MIFPALELPQPPSQKSIVGLERLNLSAQVLTPALLQLERTVQICQPLLLRLARPVGVVELGVTARRQLKALSRKVALHLLDHQLQLLHLVLRFCQLLLRAGKLGLHFLQPGLLRCKLREGALLVLIKVRSALRRAALLTLPAPVLVGILARCLPDIDQLFSRCISLPRAAVSVRLDLSPTATCRQSR